MSLPYPVQRFFVRCLNPRSTILSVQLKQLGKLRLDTNSSRWMTFEADHIASVAVPHFEWRASVRFAPLLKLNVRDSFDDGVGSGELRIFSGLKLSSTRVKMEMNSGTLHRYLAESVWYPSLLLPGNGVVWTPINDHKALATLSVKDITVALEFWFTSSGEVSAIFTPGRWKSTRRGFIQAPWEGHFRDYTEQDGFRIPMSAEVGWYNADIWQPVWYGKIKHLSYQLSQN